jgi:GcrA cell cycle regulator
MSPGARLLLDLPRGCCVWPIGDSALDSSRWCGKPALPFKPYCARHAARAYERERGGE